MKNWKRIESNGGVFFGFFQIPLDIQMRIPYNEGNRSDHAGAAGARHRNRSRGLTEERMREKPIKIYET